MAIFGNYGSGPGMRLKSPGYPQNPAMTSSGTGQETLDAPYKLYSSAVEQQAGDYSNIMSGYKDLAATGGYSSGDIANIRERGISPIRSAYAGAVRDIDRQKGLQGGYAPGYAAVRSRLTRGLSESLAKGSTDVNAGIAEMVARGKQAGLAGQASIYGTTPAMASLFGNQALNAAQLQNQINQQNQQNEQNRIPQISQAMRMFG
jgi:hypothetical protein